jgi:fermentation-respiration switch protein FrsA (DUF1100 family)
MPITVNPVRARLSIAVIGAVALTGLGAPAGLSSADAAAPRQAPARGCAAGHAPYDVGTTTINVRSRGNTLRTTVAYPATSNGENATPICRQSRLIVAGHGSGGDGESAARLHSFLVEAGYVVAGPTFSQSGGYDFSGYATDVSRTITKVRRVSNRGSGVLANRLTGKVGYIGTSMGAIVGMSLVDRAGRDKRINAVVAKAGAFYGRDFHGRGGPPLLMIHGDRDTTVDYSDGKSSYRAAKRPKGFITLRGVDHGLNTGGDQILSKAPLTFCRRYLGGKKRGLNRLARAVRQSDIATLKSRW